MRDKNIYQQIESLYESFADERSKEIFINRLQYSMTKDSKWLIDVVMPYFCCCNEKWENKTKFKEYIAQRRVVIFGAGGQGVQLLEIMNALGISIACLCDNSPQKWGKVIGGKEVISVEQLMEKYSDAVVIIATYEFQNEILEQLKILGFDMKNIVYFDNGENKQYFDCNIFDTVQTKEIFVDGGCFNGANSLDFCEWASEAEKYIYAFEPDSNNLVECQNNLQKNVKGKKYELINAGLWRESTTLSFLNIGTSGSCISNEGEVKIKVAAIDDIVKDGATLIKMDIEGAEMAALEGAKNTIIKYRPKLAICVYHKPEDIVEIPLYIKKLVPEYRIWLRHYSLCANETVLYAKYE